MVRIRKDDVLIRVKCGAEYRHAFVNGLQRDLVEIMNGLHVIYRTHELDYPFLSCLQNLKMLQHALILSEEEVAAMYEAELTDEQRKAGDERWNRN